MVADYFTTSKMLERPRPIRDGINDKFQDTIVDDFNYGRPKEQPYKGVKERQFAENNKRSKPSKRLNAKGQDYVTRDREYMGGRNPDGSKRTIPKNIGSMVRPS